MILMCAVVFPTKKCHFLEKDVWILGFSLKKIATSYMAFVGQKDIIKD